MIIYIVYKIKVLNWDNVFLWSIYAIHFIAEIYWLNFHSKFISQNALSKTYCLKIYISVSLWRAKRNWPFCYILTFSNIFFLWFLHDRLFMNGFAKEYKTFYCLVKIWHESVLKCNSIYTRMHNIIALFQFSRYIVFMQIMRLIKVSQ